jgi:hypothetical protein
MAHNNDISIVARWAARWVVRRTLWDGSKVRAFRNASELPYRGMGMPRFSSTNHKGVFLMKKLLFCFIAGGIVATHSCHGQTPILQTGGASTNVVEILEGPPVSKPNSHVNLLLTWKANAQAHGFGIIRFAPDTLFDNAGPSLVFTANGYWRVLRPGEVPLSSELAANLDGEGVYALHVKAFLMKHAVRLEGNVNAIWPGASLELADFQNSKIILSGHGLEILSLSHRSVYTGSLFLVK